MGDIIKLLPDSIANQIAAGEVIQRPSSVVKELIENSIDAGSTEITLVIKEAGKVLIQVSDNGKGMSESDARMCFERHATSKIKEANDIFKIKTKGFRGEALASIAAISHTELTTREKNVDIGTKVVLIGSKFKKQEKIQSEIGTKISVKNLFFNVPARRKFLKSDSVELKHISDEFIRLALAHIDISFYFYHNNKELYRLPSSNLKIRISNIFGRGYESKLLPIAEEMELLNISGFVGKIEAVRKSRANQFIFVNNRFIKSNYLNHAIYSSYDEYIAEGMYPIFFIFLKIDPDKIDINIHPTKQEIKFEDERLIYNYIKVSIKHVIGKFTYKPSFDFEMDKTFNSLLEQKSQKKERVPSFASYKLKPNKNRDEWEKAFEVLKEDQNKNKLVIKQEIPSSINSKNEIDGSINLESNVFQLHNTYILKQVNSGFILIDQKNAHERVLYEQYINLYQKEERINREQLLFPQILEVDKYKIDFVRDIFMDLNKFGFDLEVNKDEKIEIKAIPANGINKKDTYQLLEQLIDDTLNGDKRETNFADKFARKLSKVNSRNRGEQLNVDEMKYLVEKLFNCENPYASPSGKKCFVKIEMDEIIKRFNI